MTPATHPVTTHRLHTPPTTSTTPPPPHHARPTDAATLLRIAPQTVPFPVRLEVFRMLLHADKQRGKWALPPIEGGPRPIAFVVRRGREVESGMVGMSGLGEHVKGPFMITFVDQHGRQVCF